MGHVPPKFLENIFILCFEKRFSKQNSVIRLKSNILFPPIFGPQIFGLATPLTESSIQGRIHPASLGGAISVIFGSQVSLLAHYCKSDEAYFTTLLWQNSGRQNIPISRMLFSELFKIMVKKVTFVGFRGGIVPPWFHKSLIKRSLTYVQASTSCLWLGVSMAKWPIGYLKKMVHGPKKLRTIDLSLLS